MIKMTYISANYRRVENGYEGFVRIWDAGQLLYTRYCKIIRLTLEDAVDDAYQLKADISTI